ncbi:hypothetical protein BH11BAC6_BH11BAC6_08950 [soil metagenome]
MTDSKNSGFDIILEILHIVIVAQPQSTFAKSLLQQYLERGSLSKKQLEGLHNKAAQLTEVSSGRLATLEAAYKKMPNRFKSEVPPIKPLDEKDETVGVLIKNILEKYPQHKRVLYFQLKYNNNETLAAAELAELKKFSKMLV